MDLSAYTLLAQDYFMNDTVAVARDLIGQIFVKREPDGNILAGTIVETEAYVPHGDLANHSARGKTPRNAPMHENGGILYVYLIYGIHHCVNFVTEAKGEGAAVLIRAIEPISGIELMQKRRKTSKLTNLCSGPGKLAQAYAMTKADNFKVLGKSEYSVYAPIQKNKFKIVETTRIGIRESKDLEYRFYMKGSKCVSVL